MAKKKTKKTTKSKRSTPARSRVVSRKTGSKKVSRKAAPRRKRKGSLALGAVALILNALIFPLPGIGSLVGGRVKVGIWQIILGLIGDLLFYYWIGIPIWAFAWIWGIVTGIQLIKEAE